MVWYTQYLCWCVVEWGRTNRVAAEEHEDCVEEGFQLAKVKFDRDDERDKEAPAMGNCSINI